MYKDAVVPNTNAYKLFWFFYVNKNKGCPVSNQWDKNLGKFLAPKVFLDVDLVKELIKAYELATRTFYTKDMSVLCYLDKNAVIEAFGLDGPMSKKVDVEYLNKRFNESKNSFTKVVMKRYII